MSDYNCPECNCGFTKKMGKKSVETNLSDIIPETNSKIMYGIYWFTLSLMEYMQNPYIIVCPNCGYKF